MTEEERRAPQDDSAVPADAANYLQTSSYKSRQVGLNWLISLIFFMRRKSLIFFSLSIAVILSS
jgi:hypothetical protein